VFVGQLGPDPGETAGRLIAGITNEQRQAWSQGTAADLKSVFQKRECGFDSRRSHQFSDFLASLLSSWLHPPALSGLEFLSPAPSRERFALPQLG
jgi:hypothetical protein